MNSKERYIRIFQLITGFSCVMLIASILTLPVHANSSGAVSFYVVDKEYVNNWGGKSSSLMKSYSYNKDGLLESVKEHITKELYKYKYDENGNIVEVRINNGGKNDLRYIYLYDKDGKLIEIRNQPGEGAWAWGDSYLITCNKKGWITKAEAVYYEDEDGSREDMGNWRKYKYDNSGHVIEYQKKYNNYYNTAKYSYNKKKDLVRMKDSHKTVFNLKRVYNKNGLTYKFSGDGSYTYIYKKIKVKRKLLTKAKAQRWSIPNWDLNNAFFLYMK